MTQTATEAKPPEKFWLGEFHMTKEASAKLDYEEVLRALRRHHNCDWGDVSTVDEEANDNALDGGGRLFSAYHDSKGVKFWIITESDRNSTTVLLPDDY